MARDAARLQLTWPGKDRFLLTPAGRDDQPVWVDRDHPAAHEVRLAEFGETIGEVSGDPHADNLLFTGDALAVLRILAEVPEYRRLYRGRVKLIYLDPPFNTGQAFEHYDDWMEHSVWLSFMRERLLLCKDLLAPDGSIWVHLDDAEVHRMRCVMDEVFGAGRFVATVVWQKRYSRDNRPAIGTVHDYVLVYSPAGSDWKHHRHRLPPGEKAGKQYTQDSNDGRGPWRGIPMDVQAGHASPSQFYEVRTPAGVVHRPAPGRAWSVNKDKMEQLISEGKVYFGKAGTGKPNLIRYLSEHRGLVPWTWWPQEEVGHNDEAKKEAQRFAGENPAMFDTPKPERLLERVVHIGSDPGDIVVDVFGGSGTTAAVAHKMGRRWVTAEILPNTVATFTRPRLEKVVDGEHGGISEKVEWTGGGGFRCVTIGPSMYEAAADGTVLLSESAVNGRFARAVAGQLGFEWAPDGLLCGVRGRMRLAVVDGAVGVDDLDQFLGAIGDGERITLVAKVVLPGVARTLRERSTGSRVRKAPRDVFVDHQQRRSRRGA